ncbi:SsrA-binding protein SmpB [Solidesulfovibrio magneticus]|uniref:SsrA-binding protein n=1 Tax=Solidesulfovibrio magneticus (strain ATCC 700980 / DSM 13731 / RS-1) TaxID=573370 RepID=SSRP_SOLM1|nr:SsrA-binding protein SmpB [Solidesulfovibrio magneticus]C4XJ76.1 RecName: Full=SsrA-binding protein; AltName: Full=Small protein B [Solidesulfovibrio magneticus RS-1]BAH74240.1 SsrA-binding protein [Solidesulfovibrio magneticus RS-1]
MAAKESGEKLVALNKKARHLYEFLEKYEAGLVLMGSEVKSLRLGRISFKDGYVKFQDGEAFMIGVHIAPYENAGYAGHEPERPRKLLLHAAEINAMRVKVEQKGLTVVPVRVYFKNGRAKVEIALARGKKVFDRRDDLKSRDLDRDAARELARH